MNNLAKYALVTLIGFLIAAVCDAVGIEKRDAYVLAGLAGILAGIIL